MKKPISLLIVDDNPQFLQTISEYLREHFSADINIIGTAESGEKAIELVKKHEPNLVLLDMKMPEIHGFDVIPLIRQNHLSVKIILTTLLPADIYKENVNTYENSAKLAGANAFIPKSLLTTELISLIRRVSEQEIQRFISLKVI